MIYSLRTAFAPLSVLAIGVVATGLMLPAGPLFAQSDIAETVGQTLVKTMSKVSGDTFAYETARFEEADNVVVLEKVTLTRDKAKRPSIIIDETRIVAPEILDDGGFKADEVTTEGILLQSRAVEGTVASASAFNVTVQPAEQIVEGAVSQWFRYQTSSMKDIQLGGDADNRLVTIASIDTVADINGDNIPVAGEVELEDISIQIAKFPDSRIKQDIVGLGYQELNLSLSAKGSYAPEDENLTVERFQLTGDDTAALSLTAAIGGIPQSFMASPLDPRAIIATASIGNLDLNIDDNSLANRVLSAQAEKMGVEPDALAAQLSGALPFFLAVLDNEAFQKQVADAVSAFLSDPQTFSVLMAPEKPTPFIQVFAALTSAPGTVVDLLGLSISANE